MREAARAHIVIPRDLLAAVDRLVGSRRRSEFVTEALREKVAREERGRALREAAGILDPAEYPEWDTSEKVSAWVHASRAADALHAEAATPGGNRE